MGKIIKTELVEKYIDGKGIVKSEFCRRCGITPVEFGRLMSGDGRVRLVTIDRVARVIGIDVRSLLCG